MASGLFNAMKDLNTMVVSAVASEGNVGDNVFSAGGDHDALGFPYIIIEDESPDSSGLETHDGSTKAENFEFSIHIHTKGRKQGLQLHDLIVDGLHGFSGVQGNTTFGHILREGGVHHYRKETKSNEQVIDFTALLTNN